LRIAISGSSGFVGKSLMVALEKRGVELIRLVRNRASVTSAGFVFWNPETGEIDACALENLDVIIHLAGNSVGKARWTEKTKRSIRDSRVCGTSLLVGAISQLKKPPRLFLSASAVGIYGNRQDEILDESSSVGVGFLSAVARDWESEASKAQAYCARVVSARFGVILDPSAGALAKMLPIFRRGLGGRLGSGTQFMSWISLEDAIAGLLFILDNDAMCGPVNVVSPDPVSNSDFTNILTGALGTRAFFPVPAFILRAIVGEMADELLLSSHRALPRKLLDCGFKFKHSTLRSFFEGPNACL